MVDAAGLALRPSVAAQSQTLGDGSECRPTVRSRVPAEHVEQRAGTLDPEAAAFLELLVDHMVPPDEHSPKGTDMGVHTFMGNVLTSSWARGDRTYLDGPWKEGTASQGYQGRLTPLELVLTGIAQTNACCRRMYGAAFHQVTDMQREKIMLGLQRDELSFENEPSAKDFFDVIYSLVVEGMFSDPIYGGNRGKAAWKMVGFPGLSPGYRRHLVVYRDTPFVQNPVGIDDVR